MTPGNSPSEPVTKPFRSPWLTLAASLFLIWHSLVIVIGPAPGSYLLGRVYRVFDPYLSFFHLENYWAFFAPNPASGNLLRYAVRDEYGQQHIFKLTEDHRRSEPAYLRHTTFYTAISDHKDPGYTASAARYLCQRHAGLKPASIVFITGQQLRLPRQAWLDGKRPLDDDYMEVVYQDPISCRA